MGILAYIVIAIVIGYVTFFLRVDNDYNVMVGTEILRDLFLSAIYYLGTYYILKTRLICNKKCPARKLGFSLTQYQTGYDGADKNIKNTGDSDSQATHGSCYRAVSKGCSRSDSVSRSSKGKAYSHWIINLQPLQKSWSNHTGQNPSCYYDDQGYSC